MVDVGTRGNQNGVLVWKKAMEVHASDKIFFIIVNFIIALLFLNKNK
jgi:hypothetical protein